MQKTNQLGNSEILNLPKTAFLCSRKVPASIVLKCYDWAIEQCEQGNCVVSGFQSQLEKDVLHYLLKGHQPIILVLARGMKKQLEPDLQKALDQNRLLIITPFSEDVKRVTEKTAQIRNRMMIELADTITLGFISKGGLLEELIKGIEKKITYL